MNLSVVCALMLQPLAIRNQVQRVHTFTSLSDYYSSWNGLGASLSALYDNLRLRATVLPILTIAIYFGSITGLQTTTPLIFATSPLNVTMSTPVRTSIGYADFGSTGIGTASDPYSVDNDTFPATNSDGTSNPELVQFNWYLANAAVTLLNNTISVDTPGVFENIVYDTLLSSAVNGTARVNRTEFDVNCGYLNPQPNVTALLSNDFISLNFTSNDYGKGEYPFMVDIFEWSTTGAFQEVDPFGSKLLLSKRLRRFSLYS
jgi:hypothetical protein